jgi:uncharacterized protein
MGKVTRMISPSRLAYTVTAGRITTAFIQGILEGKLLGRRCPDCSKVYIPPRGSCPTCAVPCRDQVELAGTGTVTTFCIVNIPFEGQLLDPPYACAHVLLDGADVPLLHLVGGCDVQEVRMGLRVSAVWAEDIQPTLASVMYFQPTGEPDAAYETYEAHL